MLLYKPRLNFLDLKVLGLRNWSVVYGAAINFSSFKPRFGTRPEPGSFKHVSFTEGVVVISCQ